VCDTLAVVPDEGPVWFAKNSDREPNELQLVECDEGDATQTAPKGWPVDPPSERALLSRPAWMWGAEIGVNEHGVAIGNEAVFTRLPVPKEGRSGMDFLRIALGVSRTAEDALDLLIDLTERFVQGGPMGHRNRTFRYNSSFIVADPTSAWVFETAGNLWAAKRIRGAATISNELTIQDDFDRVHTGAYEVARKRGWVKSASAFSFAAAFSDPVISNLAGAGARRACTSRSLAGVIDPQVRDFIAALSDHGGMEPTKGWRGMSPCAHASWFPTRHASQTTSSIVARLDAADPKVWATGTSSPCLSAFKPVPFDASLFPLHPIADDGYESSRLWWAHERLHRACLEDYEARRATFDEERQRFQDECLQQDADPRRVWKKHRALIDEWLPRALAVKSSPTPLPTRLYWKKQSRASSMPAQPSIGSTEITSRSPGRRNRS
jgi:dipeptidase